MVTLHWHSSYEEYIESGKCVEFEKTFESPAAAISFTEQNKIVDFSINDGSTEKYYVNKELV